MPAAGLSLIRGVTHMECAGNCIKFLLLPDCTHRRTRYARKKNGKCKSFSRSTQVAIIYLSICTHTYTQDEYKHFWLAGKYGCRGRDKANAAQLLPSLKTEKEKGVSEGVVMSLCVCGCMCVCNYSYAFDIFAKDM